MEEKNSYIINYETLLLLPIENGRTRVYERDDSFIVNDSCLSIVENSCLYFGSSLEGRIMGTKSLINCQFKLPIIIEDGKTLIVFPTSSPKRRDTIWISYNNLVRYEKGSKNNTILVFIDDKKVDINVKFNIIDNQFIRCVKLRDFAYKRKSFLMRE